MDKRKQREIDTNPCLKEQKLSFRCLSDNNFDHSLCYIHFKNYQECKNFWNNIRIERMRSGIEPIMPKEEERQQILKDRFKKKKCLG